MLSKIKLEWPRTKIELDVRLEQKNAVAPYRTIDWQPIKSYMELSICASIYRRSSAAAGRWRDAAFGQCRGEVREHATRLEAPQSEALLELLSIWERWHLNGMNAGQRSQRDALQRRAKEDPTVHEYSAACEYLTGLGLNPVGTVEPYRYGTAWLVELVPPEVTTRLQQLCQALGGKVLEAA